LRENTDKTAQDKNKTM